MKECALTSLEALIKRIILRQIHKPRTYHPILVREFTAEELELLFGGPTSLEECYDNINAILEFAKREEITSPKVLFQCCRMIYPNRIEGGFICGDPFIEISTDSIQNMLFIEVSDYRKTLSKAELIALCKKNE